MDLHVHDAGFVRAPVDLVYRRLVDVASWSNWWPGARVRRDAPNGGSSWLVDLPTGHRRRLRYALEAHGWRPDVGFLLELRGDIDGAAEFWLEETHGGTVVHHLFDVRTDVVRPRRVLTDHRRAVRSGLWGLKDALQLEARSSAGLIP